MNHEIFTGPYWGLWSRVSWAKRAQRRRLFQNETNVLRTRSPRTHGEPLVHARQSAEVTTMTRTRVLAPSSSHTKRLGDRGEGRAQQLASMLVCAGAVQTQGTFNHFAQVNGWQSLPGGSESDCIYRGGAESSINLMPSPCPSTCVAGFSSPTGECSWPLVH